MTIGTNAMYAYACAASVTFADSIMATQDLDLLWDSRSKLRIASRTQRACSASFSVATHPS